MAPSPPGEGRLDVRMRDRGPYVVASDVPLRRIRPVVDDDGHRVDWEDLGPVEVDTSRPDYVLCRCGASGDKPFCDVSHRDVDVDLSTNTPDGTWDERARDYGDDDFAVRDDRGICAHAAYCVANDSTVWKMAPKADDEVARDRVMAMVGNCPSGALVVRRDGREVEPDLPAGISVVDDGPLWLTGRLSVQLPDGSTLESRNRVTLCRCGQSSTKPLCDGSHRDAFTDP